MDTYYEPIITYNKLVLGYEMTTLEIRGDLATLLLLRDIVNSKINSPKLLERSTSIFHLESIVRDAISFTFSQLAQITSVICHLTEFLSYMERSKI